MTPSRWVRWTLGIVALLGAVGCGERKPPAGPAIAPSSPAPAPQSDEELPYYLKEDIVGDTAREEPFAEEALLYRWRGDEPYNYDLKATVEHGDAVTETTASLVYYLDSVGEPMVAGLPPETETWTGVATVVAPDGFLVTSGHVVRDTSRIEVRLGPERYPAKVIVLDDATNLALLKIDAAGLAVAPLGAVEEPAEQAELQLAHCRPDEILGPVVQLVPARRTGRYAHGDLVVMGLDAGLRPGNSGAPVLDAQGAVVGLGDGRLAGEAPSDQGFFVPLRSLQALMETHRLPWPAPAEPIAAAELPRRLAASVAMVHGEIVPGDATGWHWQTVKYVARSRLRTGKRTAAGTEFGMPAMTDRRDRGQIVANRYGTVLRATGVQTLPGPLGLTGTWLFQTLPADEASRWSRRQTTSYATVVRPAENAAGGIPTLLRVPACIRPPLLVDGLPGTQEAPFTLGPGEKARIDPAWEEVEYSLEPSTRNDYVCHTRHRFVAMAAGESPPRVEMEGEGTIRFGKVDGVPRSIRFSAHWLQRGAGAEETMAINIELARVPPKDQRAGTRPDPNALPGSATGPEEPNLDPAAPARVADWVRTLNDPAQAAEARVEVLTALAGMKPLAQSRDAVAEALNGQLLSTDSAVRAAALRAAAVWATPVNVEALITLLEDRGAIHRIAVVVALGRAGGPEAAAAVAQLIGDPMDGMTAMRVIREFGAEAEPALLPILESDDPQARWRAASVLGSVGGPRSIAALEEFVQSEPDIWARQAAQRSLRRLQAKQPER